MPLPALVRPPTAAALVPLWSPMAPQGHAAAVGPQGERGGGRRSHCPARPATCRRRRLESTLIEGEGAVKAKTAVPDEGLKRYRTARQGRVVGGGQGARQHQGARVVGIPPANTRLPVPAWQG